MPLLPCNEDTPDTLFRYSRYFCVHYQTLLCNTCAQSQVQFEKLSIQAELAQNRYALLQSAGASVRAPLSAAPLCCDRQNRHAKEFLLMQYLQMACHILSGQAFNIHQVQDTLGYSLCKQQDCIQAPGDCVQAPGDAGCQKRHGTRTARRPGAYKVQGRLSHVQQLSDMLAGKQRFFVNHSATLS